ncbi:MFS general substrate transporter domain-containing protein [Dioscorea alata]|uniref:MFS general substrate transporter domain-containing protein n=1 Tax=Dioscorea alata TaxID=55571 RepID=A0ACB7V6E4_DIOAL|nr:MFS general substrate transporter domain-containing protein [Dioscorea alata]
MRTCVGPGTTTGRWLGLVTAVWVQCISGNNYTFSNYSDAIKSLMGLSQLQLNNLSVAKDVGKAFGLLAGLASDRVPTSTLLLIGSVEGLIGYGAQWLVVSETISPPPYWQMCVYLCLGGNSTTWMNTAVLVTCIRNFRQNRGPVSGLLKGFVGLSTAIFTDLCSALFADDPAKFLLMLAIVPFAVCCTAMLFLRESPPSVSPLPAAKEDDETETKYFNIINALAVVVAVYLLSFDMTGEHGQLLSRAFSIGLIILLALPVAIPIYIWFKEARSRANRAPELDLEVRIEEPLLIEKENGKGKEKAVIIPEDEEKRQPSIGEEHTIFEALRTIDFWILFVSFLCGVGTGLAVMNNMAHMGLALGYDDVSIFVSLTSIWGFFGRIASGSISEYFLKKRATPRAIWNAASQILMAMGYIIMATAPPGSLYIGSIAVGLCYGVRLSITVPMASELFGLKSYGLIYNMIILNLPLGSFLFSGLLAGYLYDAHATKSASGANTCIGAHCYRLVFVIMAIACVVGFGLDLVLAFRTKKLYRRIHSSKVKKALQQPIKC